jgi:L-arabinose isomerase
MIGIRKYVFWFVTGSQHLYGEETLAIVAEHARIISDSLGKDGSVSYEVVCKPVLTTPDGIRRLCIDAVAAEECAGIITWMHTFSPAKMWIAGLSLLTKPMLHLHTQFNRDIPWDSIDMGFMNTNQSAHGDREFGHICARMRVVRKVVAGYWEDKTVTSRIGGWMRTAVAFAESKKLKVARFGDNMREVAVTEGDKVEAQVKFGWSVNGYGVGDLASAISNVSDSDTAKLAKEYGETYEIPSNTGQAKEAILEQSRIELGMRAFLESGGFGAFTTTFEDLHGMKQLPGLAVQRLMASGYGFGAEGDWKTSALVRLMKIMAGNEATSFMEDYTYHLEPGNQMILGAHMLEICPSIAKGKPRLEVHPLSIGGKADPARLVFDCRTGNAVAASLVDLGNRFRIIVSEVESVKAEKPMPKLPVARVLWKPFPSLELASEAWLYAGGAHHTSFSFVVTAEHIADWAEMTGTECIMINKSTTLASFRSELRMNDVYYGMR